MKQTYKEKSHADQRDAKLNKVTPWQNDATSGMLVGTNDAIRKYYRKLIEKIC